MEQSCLHCKVHGADPKQIKDKAWIRCPLYKGRPIHMAHCKDCDHRADRTISNVWCTWYHKKT